MRPFPSAKNPKIVIFEIYPSPVGTDQSESNPIHLEMYTGNIIFNFVGDMPRCWGDLVQFEALLSANKFWDKFGIFTVFESVRYRVRRLNLG